MENYAIQKAEKFLRYYPRVQSPKLFFNSFDPEFDSLLSDYDQMLFTSKIAQHLEAERIKHEKRCTTVPCAFSEGSLEINYKLQHLLANLGVQPEGQYSSEQADLISKMLDDLLQAYKEMGENYDALKQEVADLKAHFFMGKKRWPQYAAGKFGEMIAGGIIGEEVSKPIIEAAKNLIIPYLGHG